MGSMYSSLRDWRLGRAKRRGIHALAASILIIAVLFASNAYARFNDPLNVPAVASLRPALEPMLAIAAAGGHLVAVGARGVIIVSDTAAQHWAQAMVPVQSDLTAVQFADPNNGWACGHDGTILHSTDGGLNWIRALDGIQARKQFEESYRRQIGDGNKGLLTYLQQVKANYDAGPWLPWLGIWFKDADTGYVIGSFGDIAITQDGGKTWQPWLDHIDNPNFLDLNAIREVGGQLYIVGELGSVYRFDATKNRFIAIPTVYAGSLFGVTGTAKALIVFGLRGTIYRSADHGNSWVQVENSSSSSIVNGWTLDNGDIVLVTVDGGILISRDAGVSFEPATTSEDMTLTDVIVTASHHLVLAGLGGIRYAASAGQ